MDPANQKFYATTVAPELLHWKLTELVQSIEDTTDDELASTYREIAVLASVAEQAMTSVKGARKLPPAYMDDFPPSTPSELPAPAAEQRDGNKQKKKKKKHDTKTKPQKRTLSARDLALLNRKNVSRTPQGRMLRRLRVEHNMTQHQLYERTGIHPVTISQYETGRSTYSSETAKRLANALGVTPEELLRGDAPEHTTVSHEEPKAHA